MKSFLDTSVLIPAFLEDHEHHPESFEVFVKAEKRNACCAAHSLAEVYSALTRIPAPHRLGGDQALLFLQMMRDRLTIICLDEQEYYSAIEAAAAEGIVGGSIYDALLVRCAIKARAETIYTWNVKHFCRMGREVSRKIQTP